METMQILEKLTPKTHQIEWVYWDKIIKMNTFKVPNNNKIIINIHGTFWSMNWWNNKYLNFAQNLQNDEVANVVLYESSRKNIEIDSTITDRYKQKQAKFIWKTFTDELEDARRVLKDIIKNSQELFWIENENLEITLNGNSLWWILAFYLAKEFPQVKTIVSVWTWLRLEIKDVPILDTFPDIDELKEVLQAYNGKYVSYYWTEDDVFTKQSFFDLINLVWSEQKDKSQIEMIWVDHTFWKIAWEESPIPYKQVFLWHTTLIQTWEMISWWHDMTTKLKSTVQIFKSNVDDALLAKYWTPDDENKDNLFFG